MATPLELAELAFNEIRESFPDLSCRIDREPPGGFDLELVFPGQPGLSFEIDLNLQNVDELHLNASGLWAEWFPCTKPDVLTRYVEAVRGVLAGSHRILQHRRGGRLVKSYLQRPVGESWETIARYSPGISLPFLRCETTVVANSPAI
jgi:hypothetical protein